MFTLWFDDLQMLNCILIYIFIFFSSRRRHTRYWRDWSSDVCSSDLSGLGTWDSEVPTRAPNPEPRGPSLGRRSEERRVGKEARARFRQMQSSTKFDVIVG